MRRAEEGSGRLKTFLSLAILVAVIFAAVRTFPAYVNNFQLQDHIRTLSTQLAVRNKPVTADEIKHEVATFAQDHGLPVVTDDVTVKITSHVMIDLDYTVPVDLVVYTLRLHFTPSADSPAL